MGHKPRKQAVANKSLRGSKKPPPPKPPGSGGGASDGGELDASLGEETRRRYLNYALSVITARALPDVRDGLKPVQRRILYAMHHDERLSPDAKHRKSAKVVGAVIGRYHPHGDGAVYDAMVRMAQDFSLRLPLIDGSGNFGSVDGDSAAAYRYTECRLAPAAPELLRELAQQTVPLRDNFDGTTDEPVVLPARLPNLLVNGSTGIAVGMATNIPPHNLKEVVSALVALIDNRDMTTTNILKYIKGPDFPLGGQMLNSKVELRQIYEAGSGAIRVRAEYKIEEKSRGQKDIIVTSIPYGVNKSSIVEKIADVIIKRKVPQLVDVRDESTTDIRVVLETKKGTDPAMVMAYLFKHTPLQLNFNVNLTALVPVAGSDVGRPERLGIKEMLEHFLDFRFEVTQKRFEFELAKLKRRIHILEGFQVVFDALDETIRIIRRSEGKKDAAGKLMKRFDLDEIQVDAILELRLYKLAKLEILVIREELAEKQKEAKRIEGILKSKRKLWGVIKSELGEMTDAYGTPRRTKIGALAEEIEFDEDAYILDEDAHVVLTRDGWFKRLREVKDPKTTRVREGDEVMAVLPGSTKENVVFFTNMGSAYVTRINDIPATTGYGDPAQKLFKFKDGEKIVAAYSMDPRLEPPKELLAVSARGFGLRFLTEGHSELTTRSGRRYARPAKNDEIVDVVPVHLTDVVVVATMKGHVLLCKAKDINRLEGPGKGVTVIKTSPGDAVIGFIAGGRWKESLGVETTKGSRQWQLHADAKKVTSRGGKGHQIVKRSNLKLIKTDVVVPSLGDEE
ncbi:MAG: DNA topoisomerase IV subunit A [Deltaproteobacteria bacterium]|nr:DNA topoisomerase IV subunit A [Deltaproteobacteria bacterium]